MSRVVISFACMRHLWLHYLPKWIGAAGNGLLKAACVQQLPASAEQTRASSQTAGTLNFVHLVFYTM